MRSDILNKLAIGATAIMLLAACHTHKQVAATPGEGASVSSPDKKPSRNAANEKLAAIRAKQVNFNTFSGKAKAKLDINGNSNDVTLNVRIQRDKKIWVSVTALLGIEVARAVITPDSILVLNRLQGNYMKKPFGYIYQYAPQQVNYKTIESLLTGNAVPELLKDGSAVDNDGANTVVTGNLANLMYKLIIGPDFKVSQTNLSNQAAQSLQVTNSAFIQASGGRVMPSQIDISSSAGNKKAIIGLHYNNADFDQVLDYPFSIPDRFQKVD